MHEERLKELLSRFQGTRRYVWRLVAVAIVLALAVNLLASVIFAHLGTYSALSLGLSLAALCLAYLGYARLRDNTYSVAIKGYYMLKGRKDENLLSVPRYFLASEFHSIAEAIFKENPAFERQWTSNVQEWFTSLERLTLANPATFRIATEIAEYILLHCFSLHLDAYFNGSTLKESELQTLYRRDIPDVLLSNRVLELISRDLKDRPWYKPSNFKYGDVAVASFGPEGRYSQFKLTLPKGSTITRSGPGSLEIKSKMITLGLHVSCQGYLHNLEPLFVKYYLNIDDPMSARPWPMEIHYSIDAHIRRGLGIKSHRWPYYLWLESFINKAKEQLGAAEFMQRIAWDLTEALLAALETGGFVFRHANASSKVGEPDTSHHGDNE